MHYQLCRSQVKLQTKNTFLKMLQHLHSFKATLANLATFWTNHRCLLVSLFMDMRIFFWSYSPVVPLIPYHDGAPLECYLTNFCWRNPPEGTSSASHWDARLDSSVCNVSTEAQSSNVSRYIIQRPGGQPGPPPTTGLLCRLPSSSHLDIC